MTTITEIGTEVATAMDTCMEANANAGTAIVVGSAMDTAEDWLTRPRIGQLAGKNEQTIDRDIKRHGFEPRSLPNGTKLFRRYPAAAGAADRQLGGLLHRLRLAAHREEDDLSDRGPGSVMHQRVRHQWQQQ